MRVYVLIVLYRLAFAFQDKDSEGTEEVLSPSTKVNTHQHTSTHTFSPYVFHRNAQIC